MISMCRIFAVRSPYTALSAGLLALVAATAPASPASAQEVALKAGMAVSSFKSSGEMPFDGRFTSTSFGAHARFRMGPVALQPELHMVSRGGSRTAGTEENRLRLEYLELPVMLVIPVRVGAFEPYAFGGPMLSLETRCRSIIEREGLKTNIGCDGNTPESGSLSFDRRSFDYGVSAGAGVSHRLGSGRVLLEGRHTWGLRDIYDDELEGVEVRNRSFVISVGYSINADAM